MKNTVKGDTVMRLQGTKSRSYSLVAIGFLLGPLVCLPGDCRAHSHPPYHHHHDEDDTLCGSDPSREVYLVDEARSVGLDRAFRRRRRKRRHRRRQLQSAHNRRLEKLPCDDQCIEIETRVHFVKAQYGSSTVIPHPTAAYERLLGEEYDNTTTTSAPSMVDDLSTPEDIQTLFQANVRVLNEAFTGTPFRFRFNATASRSIVDTEWTHYGGEFRTDMYQALASGDSTILDVFLVYQLGDRRYSDGSLSSTVTAMSSFAGEQLAKEGIVLRYNALTGGGHPTHDAGHILTHEVGHFLGLFHVFQQFMLEACRDRVNDLVDDTPVLRGDSKGSFPNCTLYLNDRHPLPDTCPDDEGVDPFFNYMNYVSEGRCWQEAGSFTPGQIKRMHRHWLLFREFVSTCENPDTEMEIEVVLLLDHDHGTDNLIRVRDLITDEELFNSYADYTSILSNRRDPDDIHQDASTIFFDLCVPRNHTYIMSITDRKSDGFTNGMAQIYRDRTLYARVEGDFGDAVVIEIHDGPSDGLPLIISPPGVVDPVPSPVTSPSGGAASAAEDPASSNELDREQQQQPQQDQPHVSSSPANYTSYAGWSVPILAIILSWL